MSSKDQGHLSSVWLPDNPADAIVSAPSVVTSLGNLRDRFEIGFNHLSLIPGCVMLLDFTDESTSFAYDKSGLGNDMTATSIVAADYIDTSFGKAVQTDGAADLFEILNAALTGMDFGTGDFCCEVILRTSDSDGVIVVKRLGSSDGWTFELQSGVIAGRIGDGTDFLDYSGATAIDTGDIIHLALNWFGSEDRAQVLINGVEDGSDIGSNIDSITTTGPFKLAQNYPIATPKWLAADYIAVRVTNRTLDPSEFMHHWYVKTLSDGNLGGSSVLFDPQVSSFPKRKSHLITVNWKREEKTEWANLLVNTKKGSPTDITLPSTDLTELYLGGLPEVDDNVVAYHIFDGTLALDNDGSTTGRVKDWSGNNHHATLVGSPTLVNKKWGQVYDLAGATIYANIPDSDQFSFGDFSIETAFRLDTLADAVIVCKEEGASTKEYRLFARSTGNIDLLVFTTSDSNFLSFSATPGIVVGEYVTVGISFTENGDNTSTCNLVVNGEIFTPTASETGTYAGMSNLGSDIQFGRRLTGTNPIDGQIFYSRISKVARSADELIHNSLNFYKRANGIVQDTWLT